MTLIPNQPNQLFSLMPCQPGFLQILVWQAPATATSSWSCVPYSPAKGSGLSLGTDLSLGIMPCGPPPNQILLWNGQSWNCAPANEQVSDRNVKENFTTVNGRDVLGRLSQIPITRWEYIGEGPEIWNIGPMAQDFYAAFGLGEDDKHINSVDANGIVRRSPWS
ncbi:tail fiber domain-containing protein [Candidatus Acetothermia bacterium]|nr:tail fiber domain-containing protein [Candidatus Acetothermia bacterium]